MTEPLPTRKLNCPHCGQTIAYVTELAGAVIECPICNGTLQLPPPPKDNPANDSIRHCPSCAKFIDVQAEVCHFCGHSLSDHQTSGGVFQQWLARLRQPSLRKDREGVSLAYGVLILGLVLLPLAMGFLALYIALRVLRILDSG